MVRRLVSRRGIESVKCSAIKFNLHRAFRGFVGDSRNDWETSLPNFSRKSDLPRHVLSVHPINSENINECQREYGAGKSMLKRTLGCFNDTQVIVVICTRKLFPKKAATSKFCFFNFSTCKNTTKKPRTYISYAFPPHRQFCPHLTEMQSVSIYAPAKFIKPHYPREFSAFAPTFPERSTRHIPLISGPHFSANKIARIIDRRWLRTSYAPWKGAPKLPLKGRKAPRSSEGEGRGWGLMKRPAGNRGGASAFRGVAGKVWGGGWELHVDEGLTSIRYCGNWLRQGAFIA